MPSHRRSFVRSIVAFLSVASALVLVPGCELATHFGDYQGGDAADTGGTDGSRADGGDGGDDGGLDGAVDTGVPPMDGGHDGGGGDSGVATHTVTVTISGTGTATLASSAVSMSCTEASSPCDWTVPQGSLTITSTPGAFSSLTSWDGACTGTAIGSMSCTIDVSADVAVGATYALRQVTLDVGVTGVGRVTSTSPATLGIDCSGASTGCSARVDAGTSVTLHAVPGSNYTFSGWTLPSCTGTGDCTFVIDGDTTVDATFTDGRVAVRVALGSGDGNGNISADTGAIDCGSTCSDLYVPGTHVVLTATPTLGSNFTGWSSCPTTPSTNTCAFDVPATGSTVALITASFTLQRFTLTVDRGGSGNGTVSATMPTISCGTGAGCVANNVAYGTVVTLTELASGDSTFTGWGGVSGCSSDPACAVTVTANTTVNATFDLQQVHVTFGPSASATGSGTITTDDDSIHCTMMGAATSGTCAADVPIHTPFTIYGNPLTGSTFSAWGSTPSTYCSGTTSPCTFTAEEAIAVRATFGLRHYDLTAVSLGTTVGASTGSGTVTFAPGSVASCPSSSGAGNTCVNNYAYGAMVTLTATPSSGTSVFAGWGGDCLAAGTSSTCMVTIAAATNVTASFAPNVASLNVTTSGTAQGTVSDGGAINCGAACSASFTSGTSVTLTATANTANGYVFTGWSGACAAAGSNPVCTVMISGATNVGADFSLSTRTVTVNIGGPAGGGSVTDSSGTTCSSGSCMLTHAFGSSVTLSATSSAGYTFVGWTNCPSAMGTQCTISPLTTNVSVTATFAVQTVTIALTFNGSGGGAVSGTGFNCHSVAQLGDVCQITVPIGSTVSASALANPGSTFASWNGACTGNAGCSFTASAATTQIVAIFSLQQHPLTIQRAPMAGGTVTSTAPLTPMITCGSSCTASFDHNTLVRLQATAAVGFRFVGWSVLSCGSASTCDVTVTASTTVTANFVQVRTLQVTIPGLSAGSYLRGANVSSVVPSGFSCVNNTGNATVVCSADYDVGTMIRLTSSAPMARYFGVTSWVFSGSGAGAFCGGSGAPASPDCNFTMPAGSGTLALNANFGQLGNIAFLTDGMFAPGTDFSGSGQADNLCRTQASAAGLPGTQYIAMISTTPASPFSSRITGAVPPPSGWVRVDGRPVASDATQLFSGALIHPIDVTQSGTVLPGAQFWSNTNDAGGTVSGTNNCSGWAVATSSVTLGRAGRTTRWANDPSDAAATCGSPRRFVCLQIDGGSFAPVRPAAQTSSFVPVFTTVGTRGGDQTLTSLDALCAAEAGSASLPGIWLAFVSTATVPAASRTTLSGPLVRTDGWSIGQMTAWNGGTGTALGTFGVSAAGTPLAAVAAWTGMPAATGAGGAQGTCVDWTDGGATGNGGFPSSSLLSEWAATSTTVPCNRAYSIMCIQR